MAMIAKNFQYPHLFFQKPAALSEPTPPTPDRYEYLNMIGKGSYGRVYRARDKETGEIVGMKEETHCFSKSTLREINIMKSLPRHPSIVDYKDVFVDKNRGHRAFVVMEYLEYDLKRFMAVQKKPFHIRQVKVMMQKILEGVRFLHKNNVMHRDLKPSNILIGKNCKLKICDFGLSRRAESDAFGSYSPRVGTQLYKAPELLIGENIEYSSAVDMWSVGCIMAELVLREVLFDGDSEIQQFSKIHDLVLEPCNHLLLRRKFRVAAASSGAPLLTDLGFDLVVQLLDFNPRKRITAKDALNHPWFSE